jgi:hypothetical protein
MLSPLFSSHWYQLSPFEVEMELEVQRDVVKLHFWRTTQRRTEQIAGRQQCWLGKVSTSPPGSSRAKAASEESQVGQIGWVLFHHLTQPLARSWQKKKHAVSYFCFSQGYALYSLGNSVTSSWNMMSSKGGKSWRLSNHTCTTRQPEGKSEWSTCLCLSVTTPNLRKEMAVPSKSQK